MNRWLQLIVLLWSWLPIGAQDLPPPPVSPVEPFRRWLGMTPEDREKELAEWPERNREVIRQRLKTYAALPELERERRLQMIELRHFLRPLMSVPPAQREAMISAVPAALKEIVQLRLQRWDRLSPEMQRQVLEHDTTLNFFARVRQPPFPGPPTLEDGSKAAWADDSRLERWLQISEQERRQLSAKLNEFFELPRARQSKALQTLGVDEQRELQATLDAFAQLPPRQKKVCIDSFQKFANMQPHERNSFLRNAERWQSMSPEDRSLWRGLVRALPPLPPDTRAEPPIFPAPMPAVPRTFAGSNATPALR